MKATEAGRWEEPIPVMARVHLIMVETSTEGWKRE